MKLIGKPQEFNAGGPKIEDYHRVALGLESGTQVYLTAHLTKDEEESGMARELLLTTFEPKQWQSLWRLSLVLQEQEGAVAQVLQPLRHQININILETLTTETSRAHEFLAFVDLSEYAETDSGESNREIVKERLSAELTTNLGELLLQPPAITPMTRLREAGRRLRKKDHVVADIERGIVRYDKAEFERLFFDSALTSSGQKSFPKRVMMFSDTEEKYLSMYFPRDSDCLMRVSILHRERKGAIHAFADVFKKEKANILTSYSRLQRVGDRAQWKVTADVTKVRSCANLLDRLSEQNPFYIDVDELELSYVSTAGARAARRLPETKYRFIDAITDPVMFKGQDDLVRTLAPSDARGVSPPNENYMLTGYFKTGKSSALRKAQERLSQSESILPVYLSLAGLTRVQFWGSVLGEIYTTLFRHSNETDFARKVKDYFLRRRENVDLSAIGITVDLGLLRVEKRNSEDHSEQGEEVRSGFQQMLRVAGERGFKTVVLLLDEAQDFMKMEDDSLHTIWVSLISNLQDMRWIVASSDDWRDPQAAKSTLRSKLIPKLMRPLEEAPARDLIIDPFDAMEIRVQEEAIQEILFVSGLRPCYIQAVCSAVQHEFESVPSVVDIVTKELAQAGEAVARSDLKRHFSDMYGALAIFLDEQVLIDRLLIRGEEVEKNRIFHQDLSRADRLGITLEVVPGLTTSAARTGKSGEHLRATPLFRDWWLESQGYTRSGRPTGGQL